MPQKDVDALAAELGLLGTITQDTLADKRAVFMLTTSESQDNIVAICSFVLDPDDLKITHDGAPAASQATGAAINPPAEDPGYGIFEPEKAPSAAPQAAPPTADQAAASAAVTMAVT